MGHQEVWGRGERGGDFTRLGQASLLLCPHHHLAAEEVPYILIPGVLGVALVALQVRCLSLGHQVLPRNLEL